MSAIASIHNDSVRLHFSSPWDLPAHRLFIRSKKLPEAKVQFDRSSDSYTITAPARFAHLVGLEPPAISAAPLPLATHLFDYQSFIVQRALEARRYAVWADCGLGKTPMALEWARQVSARTGGGRVLIFCPKNLIRQWMDEANKFYGLQLTLHRLETRDALGRWCKDGIEPFGICNYEKLIPGVLDEIRYIAGVVLDESSILKGGGGMIKWNLIKSCRGIEYKLPLTATPAPNDTIEYASQASFLEKLRTEGEILWTYFMRDPKTQEWKVRPHAREAFYRFMSSWSIYLRKPSAYGFQDRFDLPEPEIIEHKLAMTPEQGNEYRKLAGVTGQLLTDRLGITARSKLSQVAKGFVYRNGIESRTAERIASDKPCHVATLVVDALKEDRQVLVWTVFDEESEIIMECLRACCASVESLHGKDSETAREEKLEGFRTGKIRALVSKARLLGWGMNFQFCSVMIFSGFNDSFEQFYQAVRRAHRYGATERLKVHIPFIPELEEAMWNNLLRKKGQWESDISQQEVNYVTALKGLLS